MTHNVYGSLSVQSNLNVNGTISGGTVILNADPTTALQAATKQYVDSKSSSGGGGTSISTTVPLYVGCGASTTVSGTAIVSVYEQIADQTFNATYNTRTDYTEENNTTGTDWSNGSFTLHGTGNPDSNTKLLCHFDNGLVDDSHNSVVINGGPFSNSVYKIGSQSAYFNGSTSYLTGITGLSQYKFSGDFTVECWIYITNISTAIGSFIFDTGGQGANGFGCAVWWTTTPYLACLINNAWIQLGTTQLTANNWTHVAWVRSGSTITGYINGAITGTSTNSTNLSTGNCIIGRVLSGSNYFPGYIDELRISNNARYTTSFTPSTSAFSNDANTNLLLHFDGNLIDSSSNNLSISPNGMVTLSPKIGTSSCYFNGTSAYLQGPSGNAAFKFSADFTVECWIFPTIVDYLVIFDTQSGSYTSATGFDIVMATSTGYLTFHTNGANAITGGSPTLNSWNHVAATRSGSTITLWLNGVSQGTVSNSSNFSDGLGYIGRRGYALAAWFKGYIDEFRISQVARYTAAFTPSSTQFTNDGSTSLLLHFDGNLVDSSNNNLTMINSNAVLQGPCQFGTASAYFNGSSYLTIADGAIPALGSSNFVIEAWIYPTSLASHGLIFSKSTGSNGCFFSLNSAGSLNFYCDISGWVIATTATAIITVNNWYYVVAVRTGNNFYCYLNGSRGSTVGSSSGTISTNSFPWAIGAYGDGGTRFTGYIDELRVSIGTDRDYTGSTIFVPLVRFEDSFSNTNLLCHFDQKPNQDDSLKALTMTNSNAIEYMPINPKFGTYSGYFDGSSSQLVGPSGNAAFKFSADFTVECWYYATSFSGAASYLFDTGVSSSGICVLQQASSGNFIVSIGGSANIIQAYTPSTNIWTHLALVRSGSTISLYINGTIVGTATNSTNLSTGLCSIGKSASASYYWIGFIDEFRISNTYARYTTNFTVPSNPFTADGNTSLLLHFEGGSSTVTDSSSNNLTITNYGVGGLTPVYKFGTNACWFNGTDAYLTGVTGNNAFKFAADFTVECWFYTTSATGNIALFCTNANNSGNSSGFLLGMNSNQFYVGSSGYLYNSCGSYNINTWYHIAFVRSGTTLTLYLNGSSIGTPVTGNSTNFSNGYCWIGSAGTANYFPGYIDEFRISQSAAGQGGARYTGNFTPASSQFSPDANTYLLLHFDGNYTDSNTYNGGPLTITNYNTAQITGPKFGNGCAYFNGTSSSIKTVTGGTSPVLGTRNFVIECWVYHSGQPSNGTIISNFDGVGTSGWALYANSSNYLVFLAYIGGTYSNPFITSSSTLPFNSWTHIALSRSGSSLKMFINGTSVGSATNSGAITNSYDYYDVGAFGSSPTWFFRGFIDELRVSLDTDRGYTGSTITVPVAPFQDSANTYVNGPYYVSTTANSQINLTPYDTIAAATVSATEPNTTTLRFLCSFDNKSTWKTYSGGSWSTVTMTSANIISSGMNISQLQTALPNWTTSLGSTLDIVAAFQTSNTSASPTLDNIQITASDYHMITPNVDYTVTKTRGGGARTLTFTRLKPGNANHEIDYF